MQVGPTGVVWQVSTVVVLHTVDPPPVQGLVGPTGVHELTVMVEPGPVTVTVEPGPVGHVGGGDVGHVGGGAEGQVLDSVTVTVEPGPVGHVGGGEVGQVGGGQDPGDVTVTGVQELPPVGPTGVVWHEVRTEVTVAAGGQVEPPPTGVVALHSAHVEA